MCWCVCGAVDRLSLLSLRHLHARTHTTMADAMEASKGLAPGAFEYLDHTADVQIHAVGATPAEMYATTAAALFNYMTPLEAVKEDPSVMRRLEVRHEVFRDDVGFMYSFLNELLFVFSVHRLIVKRVEIDVLQCARSAEQAVEAGQAFFMRCRLHGEAWADHAQGTEVKAITKHGLRLGIDEEDMNYHAMVIIDI